VPGSKGKPGSAKSSKQGKEKGPSKSGAGAAPGLAAVSEEQRLERGVLRVVIPLRADVAARNWLRSGG
jgi:hypothetical protein